MTDTRLPECWLNDRRIRRLSSDGYRSFVIALMWSVSNQTDGYIDDADLDLIPGFVFPHQGELRESGLWVRVESGWHITVFAETQTSHDELVALSHARAVEREKKARWRANKKAQVIELSRGQSRGQSTVDEDRDYTGQDRTGQDSLRSSCPVPTQNDVTTEVTTLPSPKPSLRKSGTSPGERKRATRLPQGWMPPQDAIDVMRQRFPHVDLRVQHELFCNYWHAKGGQNATKLDWVATWRNWMIKAAEGTPTHNGQSLNGVDQKAAGWLSGKESLSHDLAK